MKKMLNDLLANDISKWNDIMLKKHATPYTGIAGLIEKLRVGKVKSYLNISPKDNVLELGCESGHLLLSLPDSKRKTGLDVSHEALKRAQKNAKAKNIDVDFHFGDLLEKLPFKKGEFSAIVCSEALEHVLDPQKAIKNISDICDKNTRVVITVPNEKPKLVIKSLLSKLKLLKLIMPEIEDGQSEWHLHAFSKPMIVDMMSKHFEIKKVEYIAKMHIIVEARKKNNSK